MNLTGKSFRMHRESNIRAVHLNSRVTLRDGVKVPNGAIIDSQAKADALAVVARK